MSNRYEEVIRLVLDVESDKAEKKIVDAQDRANRLRRGRSSASRTREKSRRRGSGPGAGRQNAAHTAEARVPPRGKTDLHGRRARRLGQAATPLLFTAPWARRRSIMRGRLPASWRPPHARCRLGGAGVGLTNWDPSNVLFLNPSHGRGESSRKRRQRRHAWVRRPPGMPPTPPAPPRRTPPPIPPGAPRLPRRRRWWRRRRFRSPRRLFRTARWDRSAAAERPERRGLRHWYCLRPETPGTGIRQQFAGVGTMGQVLRQRQPQPGPEGRRLRRSRGWSAQFFGPLLGTLASKLVGVYGKVIDVLDGLVAALGKYNPVVNAQARILEVQQKMFRMRMANVFQPLMSAWISLKSTVLDLMAQLLPLLRPVVGFFASFLSAGNSFLRGIKAAFIDIVAAFKWVKGMLTGDFKSFSKVREEVRRGADARLARQRRASVQPVLRQCRPHSRVAFEPCGPAGSPRASSPQPVLRLPGRQGDSTRPMREPGESLPRQATAGKDNRPSLPTPPGRPQFQQNVQNHWQVPARSGEGDQRDGHAGTRQADHGHVLGAR
jgi:hypothetical protein